MQVANALNNYIRILFNPKVESFKLFDFLMVKSESDRYLAQITEIYEDKFDASQNVAKLRLFYKVNEENEVMPYDNFTPNKECEIVKIKQEEIENFLNEDKDTFLFATNSKDLTPLNMQFEFFNNNPIILADKIENANVISLNLAKNLSKKKHVVIIDATGILEFEGAKKVKASKSFKMPLNYSTIDFVFERCLNNATLEFQAIGTEILNEIKKFAKAQEEGFIPFNAFAKVLLEQYKVTPYSELRLLLARVKKLQMDEIFARSKKDKEVLSKTVQKNEITILDLSGVDSFWQKAYLEYIIDEISEDIYLISRINDEGFNPDLINKIYFTKPNISFIPNVSYNYKKLPSVIQNCKNYILMPSLYQRGDFLDANFALSNLIPDGCIIFGENTDNFLYLAKDLEAKIEEKKINYRRIALSTAKNHAAEEKKITPSEKEAKEDENITKRLDAFEQQLKKSHPEDEFVALDNEKTEEESKEDEFQNLVDVAQEEIIEEPQEEAVEEIQDIVEEIQPIEEVEEVVEVEKTEEIVEEPQEEAVEEAEEPSESIALAQIEQLEEMQQEEDIPNEVDEQEPSLKDDAPVLENLLFTEEQLDILDDMPQEEVRPKINVMDAELVEFGEDVPTSFNNMPEAPKSASKKPKQEILLEEFSTEEAKPKIKGLEELQSFEEEQKAELSDEELDFFEIAKESSIKNENKNVVIDDVEYRTQSDDDVVEKEKNVPKAEHIKQELNIQQEKEAEAIVITESKTEAEPEAEDEEDLDLSQVANQSYDNNFDDIINNKTPKSEQTQPVEETKEEPLKETLPIYTEEQNEEQNQESKAQFKSGDRISHPKYGEGVVVKIIQYEQRQLLQIEFETGKKLLDPKVADIKPL